MSNEVFANGNEIACKSGDGKVIAAFPDVCLSPPSPPAGPVPVPYPNTSFSKDMKKGSKTVKIGGKEVMLKDKSFYKTSPLGDEAATKSLGAGVVSHVITGKTYFVAWSMDVKFEGKNVDRHIDFTTSNHASPMANENVTIPNAESANFSTEEKPKCPCCGKNQHMEGTPVSTEKWYLDNNPGQESEIKALLAKSTPEARYKSGKCSCYKKKPPTRVLPEPPCNVFIQPKNKDTYKRDHDKIEEEYDSKQAMLKDKMGVPSRKELKGAFKGKPSKQREERWQKARQLNHLVPKSAGGCPNNEGNLQAMHALCNYCQDLDKEFNTLQKPKF